MKNQAQKENMYSLIILNCLQLQKSMHSNFDFKTSNFCLFATYIKITKKFTKKFGSKVINRQ